MILGLIIYFLFGVIFVSLFVDMESSVEVQDSNADVMGNFIHLWGMLGFVVAWPLVVWAGWACNNE